MKMRLIDADKLKKNVEMLKVSDVFGDINCERQAIFEWTKSDIYKMIKYEPTVEAIPKDQYEQRLKADMVAMLDEIQLQAEENIENIYEKDEDDLLQLAQHNAFADCFEQYNDLIQEKIDALKGGENERKTKSETF